VAGSRSLCGVVRLICPLLHVRRRPTPKFLNAGRVISTLREARNCDGYERWSRRTDVPLLVLAVLFVVVLVLPLVLDLSPVARVVVTAANVAIWAVFAVDYVARLYLSLDRRRYVRTHVLDLLIVLLPMLRPLRALRVLRVLRVGSVAAFAHQRATDSLHARATVYVVSAALVSMIVSAVAIREAERGSPDANITSVREGLWWALTTVTTVGYGDQYPTTLAGRLVALGLMLVGIALLGVVTAAIAAWFVDRLQQAEGNVVQEVEETTQATLDQVLTELREVKRQLDTVSADIRPQSG
jgi:voltage-gated potassium channel